MTESEKTPQDLLTPSEAAKLLHVSPVTLRHWAINKKLTFVVTPGGHRRFRLEDIQQFLSDSKKISIKNDPTVLIVDDDAQHSRFLSDFFSEFKPEIKTVVADNGFSAADLLHRNRPKLVLLDLMMPGMDGFDVCKHIKMDTIGRDIPVIAMTGFPSTENVERILRAGAESCQSKPIDLSQLRLRIGQLFEKRNVGQQAAI
jgi:excisionase family DNA binding protein